MKLPLAGIVLSMVCGWAASVMGGGSSAGGSAQIAPTDNASVSTYKSTSSSVPGGNAYDSAGAAASTGSSASNGSGGSSTSAGGFSSGSSGPGTSSSDGTASSNGDGTSSSRNDRTLGVPSGHVENTTNAARELSREKVIDTGDKHFETGKSSNSQPKDTTFSSGLLDSANDIGAIGKERASAIIDKLFEAKEKPNTAEKTDSGKQK